MSFIRSFACFTASATIGGERSVWTDKLLQIRFLGLYGKVHFLFCQEISATSLSLLTILGTARCGHIAAAGFVLVQG